MEWEWERKSGETVSIIDKAKMHSVNLWKWRNETPYTAT